jgi:transcriptional repressor NrdR
MRCPFCRAEDTRVLDTRTSEDGSVVRRRRSCTGCGQRFSTSESASLLVAKRSGVLESFSREKVVAGVRKACQGRPVGDDQLALLAQTVEERVRASGQSVVASQAVGMAILEPLRELDEVAYLRFASVYRNFDSLADFELEIAALSQWRAGSLAVGPPAAGRRPQHFPPTRRSPQEAASDDQ